MVMRCAAGIAKGAEHPNICATFLCTWHDMRNLQICLSPCAQTRKLQMKPSTAHSYCNIGLLQHVVCTLSCLFLASVCSTTSGGSSPPASMCCNTSLMADEQSPAATSPNETLQPQLETSL